MDKKTVGQIFGKLNAILNALESLDKTKGETKKLRNEVKQIKQDIAEIKEAVMPVAYTSD